MLAKTSKKTLPQNRSRELLGLQGKLAFAELVRAAGLPSDSLRRFIEAGYIPQPKQVLFHAAARECDLPNGPTDVGFGGARGPGKSHAAFAQLVIDDCQRVPELKCLFLRKVAKAAREAFGDLRREVLRNVEHEYKSGSGVLELPNKSRVVLGHFRTEQDIDNYLGLQYDVIAIEEATQLTARKKLDIKTCLRTSKRNWRPRTYQTTNPGGVDHFGFKTSFIEPWRQGKEVFTRFIPATVRDNVFVNSEYRRNLENLVGWQRRAWLDGDWDIAAGQYFSNFHRELIEEKRFDIPASWPIWGALDYGFTHPTAVYLFAEHDGTIFVWSEHCEQKKLPDFHSAVIKERLAAAGRSLDSLDSFAAGHDCFQQRGSAEAVTIADQYTRYGINLNRAAIDRISGWSELLRRLGDKDRGIPPTLKIFDSCPRLLNCIPSLQHDPNKPEDVLKINADEEGKGGDDEADALRYGLMERIDLRQPEGAASALAQAFKRN